MHVFLRSRRLLGMRLEMQLSRLGRIRWTEAILVVDPQNTIPMSSRRNDTLAYPISSKKACHEAEDDGAWQLATTSLLAWMNSSEMPLLKLLAF